eukprot:gene13904-14022_t
MALQVLKVDIDGLLLDAAVLQALGMLSSLSRLELTFCSIASYADLAAALQKLPALRCVHLEDVAIVEDGSSGGDADDDLDPDVNDEGAALLLQALSKESLSDVRLISMYACVSVFGELRAASRLTSLVINDCGVESCDVELLLRRLTQLQRFGVNDDNGVSETTLNVISSSSLLLTSLSLRVGASTTAAGLQGLSSLTQLRNLHLYTAWNFDFGCLLQLSHLSRLQVLCLDPGPRIEDAASTAVVEQLLLALPKCKFYNEYDLLSG